MDRGHYKVSGASEPFCTQKHPFLVTSTQGAMDGSGQPMDRGHYKFSGASEPFSTKKHPSLVTSTQGAVDGSGQPIDREFYKTFWGLQAVFQQPYSIMEPSAWAAAISSIKKVLAKFRKQVSALQGVRDKEALPPFQVERLPCWLLELSQGGSVIRIPKL